jgi:hypothetical protein
MPNGFYNSKQLCLLKTSVKGVWYSLHTCCIGEFKRYCVAINFRDYTKCAESSHLRCSNLSGPSAEGLVAGRKGVVCGGCRVARYCSPACQQEDWRRHRHVCRRLAAAAAAASGLGGPPQQL